MATTELPDLKRESTSINIDPDLWKEVRKAAIDMGISATDFFEEALRRELARIKGREKK